MEVLRLENDGKYWRETIDFAENCSWVAGPHLAECMRKNEFKDWESVFAAIKDGKIVGYCTIAEKDFYPENRYSPWVSSVFVDEKCRGNRISQKMIENVLEYAKGIGFKKVYIPTDMEGFYEKYGFEYIDRLENYMGDMDNVLEYNLDRI